MQMKLSLFRVLLYFFALCSIASRAVTYFCYSIIASHSAIFFNSRDENFFQINFNNFFNVLRLASNSRNFKVLKFACPSLELFLLSPVVFIHSTSLFFLALKFSLFVRVYLVIWLFVMLCSIMALFHI